MSDTVGKEIEPDEIVRKTVNANGQVYLGRDLDGQEVVIAYEVVES